MPCRVLTICLAFICLARPALAQPLPDALVWLMRDDPARFLEVTADLVAGFGVAGKLSRVGVAEHVALTRAAARATALRRLLAMDLDNDGVVDLVELQVTQRASSAPMRGRLQRQFESADVNDDRRIAADEMRAEALSAAQKALSDAEEAALYGLILLDRDGDQAVTMMEVVAALAVLDDAT